MTSTSLLIKTLRQNLRHFFHTIVLLAILLSSFPAVCIAKTALLNGCIVRVVDGDTVKLQDDRRIIHAIRLAGIDAPEAKMPYGKQATELLTDLILGKEVVALTYKQDRYGRTIATILLAGQDVNLAMIGAGLAWHYKHYAKEQAAADSLAYSQAENMARAKYLAVWQESNPTAPWDWRANLRVRETKSGGTIMRRELSTSSTHTQ
jgi:endonuclease YncB( thermonuclease family)